MVDMHFVFDKSNGNTNRSKHLYQETFLNQRVPNRRMFIKIHRYLVENRSFLHQQRSRHSITTRSSESKEDT